MLSMQELYIPYDTTPGSHDIAIALLLIQYKLEGAAIGKCMTLDECIVTLQKKIL